MFRSDNECSECGADDEGLGYSECSGCGREYCELHINLYTDLCDNCKDFQERISKGIKSPKIVAKAIKVPLAEWPGNCYMIAGRMVAAGLVKGTLCYGLYHGPVSPDSSLAHRVMQRHGWITVREGPGNLIVDPTRWVFEAVEPYIFVDFDNRYRRFYDLCGQALRSSCRRPFPEATKAERTIKLDLAPEFLIQILGPGPWDLLSYPQAMWLATHDPNEMGGATVPLYVALIQAGYRALIPVDYRIFYLGEDPGIDYDGTDGTTGTDTGTGKPAAKSTRNRGSTDKRKPPHAARSVRRRTRGSS